MSTILVQFLATIDPRRTIEPTLRRADDAVNSFVFCGAQITDWDEFRACVVRLGRHVDSRVLGVSELPEMDLDFFWGQYVQVLLDAYGPNGAKAAFEYARTGVEGGLYGVLRKFAQSRAEEFVNNEIRARINAFWGNLADAEKMAVIDEYLSRYGHLLSSELTEGSAARLRTDFPKVLAEHVRLMQRLGDLGHRSRGGRRF